MSHGTTTARCPFCKGEVQIEVDFMGAPQVTQGDDIECPKCGKRSLIELKVVLSKPE